MMGTFDVFAGKQRRLVGDEILQRAHAPGNIKGFPFCGSPHTHLTPRVRMSSSIPEPRSDTFVIA